jgi:hypothetical protein
MNALVAAEPVSAETLETVLGTGDLTKLTPAQRVEYMTRTCQTLGLNPLTRPFEFMTLNGKTVMYAKRDCADQLRATRKINLSVVDKSIDGELFMVTVRAKTPEGREDEDMGAVTLGQLRGDARANAIMKAITKAKRRVTLSICGLGFLDESEVETLPGAATFAAEQKPVAQARTAPSSDRAAINRDVPLHPLMPKGPTDHNPVDWPTGVWAKDQMALVDKAGPHLSEGWTHAVADACLRVTSKPDLEEFADAVRERLQRGTTKEANTRIGAAVQAARKRLAAQEAAVEQQADPFADPPDGEDAPEIVGEAVGA